MILDDQILQQLLPDTTPTSLVYKKIEMFDYLSKLDTRNTLKDELFYTNHFTQSILGYENSAVDLYYDETCTPDSKTITLFFGSAVGGGANSKQFGGALYSDTKAIYSKINYMFDYTLTYENIYALEIHPNLNYDYLNTSYFQINLSGYDLLGNLTENLFSFVCSGSSQYMDGPRYQIINMVSGSLTNGEYSSSEIGKYNAEKNVIVFDADKLDTILNYNTDYTTDANATNVNIFYNSFSQSINISLENGVFPLVSTGVLYNNFFRSSIDIELTEFNYTNNPTFFDKNTNKFRSSYTNQNPNVYFTTIGLYDDKYQLLAVAKMSKPLPKNDSEKYKFEVIIKT